LGVDQRADRCRGRHRIAHLASISLITADEFIVPRIDLPHGTLVDARIRARDVSLAPAS
jgi:hypothetical protein